MSKLTDDDIILRNLITKRFIQLRESTGLNQSEFSKKNDIDRQQVNRWESLQGNRGVNIYTINKFCKLLNITLNDFFNDPMFK
ncbi:helix-turn-helix domain-containing protein [Kaistella carnis]|uniref:XRE family transcriptional regulator n=1 Tax=Kaistella carnis TaxID=1241979 RepID=A0A3G8Y0J0_9FLAO|nr:helix-turn-helix transcriptional regulator [Kaistella carnis]AZI34126.1 XRE family transcriptional regulator [Kaistella carnis]